jgi:hypothetical protein
MNMQGFSKLSAALVLASAGFNASAASISINSYDIDTFQTTIDGADFAIVEDFESISASEWVDGESAGDAGTATSVGKFRTVGGIGGGTVCNAQSGGDCDTLAINDQVLSGQGNLYPIGGSGSLSSNDTRGIVWNVFDTSNPGSSFDMIAFAVRDAADISGTVFEVSAGNSTATLSNASNNNRQLVVISLGALVTHATVQMLTAINDGFTIDAASFYRSGGANAVPLPAAAWLFASAVLGAGVLNRRKKCIA